MVSSSRLVIHKQRARGSLVSLNLILFGIALVLCAILYHRNDPSAADNVRGGNSSGDTTALRDDRALKQTYTHDHPNHPWNWSREKPPCPKLSSKVDCKGDKYGDMYHRFHEEGWVIFTSCSLQKRETTVLDSVAKFTATVTRDSQQGDRQQDADRKDVKALSLDPDTIEFLEFLHAGRRVFPFQTLNFPKGTQQPIHSDLIHFDSQPRALMTAAWVALEDMNKDNGPLRFFPKSHRWGTWDYDEIGLHHKMNTKNPKNLERKAHQSMVRYGEELEIAMEKAGLQERVASEIKRGQTFIWAAGLVHGGSKQNNMELSRLSQVTHYYFEGADYFWVPRFSDKSVGKILYKPEIRPCSNQFLGTVDGGAQFHSCADAEIERFKGQWKSEL